jgi:hypothetical protein
MLPCPKQRTRENVRSVSKLTTKAHAFGRGNKISFQCVLNFIQKFQVRPERSVTRRWRGQYGRTISEDASGTRQQCIQIRQNKRLSEDIPGVFDMERKQLLVGCKDDDVCRVSVLQVPSHPSYPQQQTAAQQSNGRLQNLVLDTSDVTRFPRCLHLAVAQPFAALGNEAPKIEFRSLPFFGRPTI